MTIKKKEKFKKIIQTEIQKKKIQQELLNKKVKRKIRMKLSFNRTIYSFIVIFMLILIYSASIILMAVSDDINNAMAHDKKLKDKYNIELERYNNNPNKENNNPPIEPDYTTLNTFIQDLPYIILSVSIYIGIYIFIAMTFFWLFPPLYDNQKNLNVIIGGISKIVLIKEKPYVLIKSGYFSIPVLISIENINIQKTYRTLLNKTSFVLFNNIELYAYEDNSGNIFLKNKKDERNTPVLDNIDGLLTNTLRKGVGRVKTASKSNYTVTIHKEMNKYNDQLLEEANNVIETEFGDI